MSTHTTPQSPPQTTNASRTRGAVVVTTGAAAAAAATAACLARARTVARDAGPPLSREEPALAETRHREVSW